MDEEQKPDEKNITEGNEDNILSPQTVDGNKNDNQSKNTSITVSVDMDDEDEKESQKTDKKAETKEKKKLDKKEKVSKKSKKEKKPPKKKKEISKKEEKEEEKSAEKKEKPKDAPGKWYVIHTYSGHENKVVATLQQRIDSMKLGNKIFDTIIPTRNVVTVKQGKKEDQKEKIFPGYILVNMILDDETWLAIRTTQGVTAFVGSGNKPTPISDSEVETIKKFMNMEAPKFKTSFSVGEAVKIVDGPFSDFLGTIDSIDEEKGKLKVLVSIFGRETPVELDFLQVNKL